MNTFQILGLGILLLFYGSYFAKQVMLGRQGIATNRLGQGEKPKQTRILERILKLSTFLMAAIQLCSVFFWQDWLILSSRSIVRFAGLAAAALGTAIFAAAMAQMRTSWRAGIDATQRTALVESGLYRFSRNPAFVGFDLFYFGLGVAFSNPVLMGMCVLCVVVLHLQILQEEAFLMQTFKEYWRYKQKTRRYL